MTTIAGTDRPAARVKLHVFNQIDPAFLVTTDEQGRFRAPVPPDYRLGEGPHEVDRCWAEAEGAGRWTLEAHLGAAALDDLTLVSFESAPMEVFHEFRQILAAKILRAHPRVEFFQAEIDGVGAVLDSGAGAIPIARGREQFGKARAPAHIISGGG